MKSGLFITLLLASAISMFAVPKDNCVFSGDDDDVIEIDVNYIPPFTGPKRSPAIVPISAVYYAEQSIIEVSFLNNIGEVDVTFTNLTLGSGSNFTIDSSFGSVYIPVNYTSGYFSVEFVTSTGDTYLGYLLL